MTPRDQLELGRVGLEQAAGDGGDGPSGARGPPLPRAPSSARLLRKRASQALQLGWSDTEPGALFSVKVVVCRETRGRLVAERV